MEPRDDRDDRPPVPRGWAWGGIAAAAATGLAAAMIWVDLFLALVPATLILLAVTAVRTPRPHRARTALWILAALGTGAGVALTTYLVLTVAEMPPTG